MRRMSSDGAFYLSYSNRLDTHDLSPYSGIKNLAALSSDSCRIAYLGKTLDCRPHYIDWIIGSNTLGENVMHSDHLENCTHRATGDDSGTL